MPEDRSLDEFAGDADGDPSDGGTEREADADAGAPVGDDGRGIDAAGEATTDTEATTDATEPIDADPATSTATWTTDGGPCDRCGESVARRWLDGGALVCTACKEW